MLRRARWGRGGLSPGARGCSRVRARTSRARRSPRVATLPPVAATPPARTLGSAATGCALKEYQKLSPKTSGRSAESRSRRVFRREHDATVDVGALADLLKPLDGRAQDNLRKWKTGGFRRTSASQPFGDVIVSNPTRASERALAPHPSRKPQAFMRQIVRAVLPLGEGIVLDPFAGSGSTLAAADAVGYESIGIERDPQYFELACASQPRLAKLRV